MTLGKLPHGTWWDNAASYLLSLPMRGVEPGPGSPGVQRAFSCPVPEAEYASSGVGASRVVRLTRSAASTASFEIIPKSTGLKSR